MEGLNARSKRTCGAFRPIKGYYNSDYPKRVPPERFVASRLVGGLKDLFSQLSNSKKDIKTKERPKENENGIIHSKPVPNLAGRYKVLHLIGSGQSSILVAAEDLHHPTKQVVAIKIMNLDYKTLGAQEADCIQQLNRADPLKVSRIIRLLNTFIYDDHYCMAFELLHPKPLHQYFQRTELDSEDEIFEKLKEVTTQILGVLGFLKRENVIHADLKPENILLESGRKMRIKVVDFGNAIRWVHQEMSLYYDNFELQTLLYRAPEVMFGVPFGPEIDMWSLGCIVAELYLGEPLFMEQSKMGILQEMVSVLGPFPRIPFQSGKFYSEFAGFISSKSGPLVPSLETRLMKKLHNMKNFTFANFLSGLLQYNPNNRLTPVQAASHPFLASHFPFAEFLTTEDELQGRSETRRSGILLTPSQYTYRPNIDDDIRRQHLSSLDLLHCGTRGKNSLVPKRTSTPPVGRVVPLVNYGRSNSIDKEDTKRHLNQGISERQTTETQATQGSVLQGGRNSTQKIGQKSVSLKIEENALPIPSNILENKNGSLLHQPAGNTRVTEGTKFLLANETQGVAPFNIPVTSPDERRYQRSSEKIVNIKAQNSNTIEFHENPSQSNDALKDTSYECLEGGMADSRDSDAVESRERTEYHRDKTSSARIRIYCRSKKPRTKKDSILQGNELSLSDTGSCSHIAEGDFVLSQGQSFQASLSSDSYLPESYSKLETSRMSYATCDRSKDETGEGYQTNNRSTSPSIKMSDIKNSSSSRKRSMLSDVSSSMSDVFSSDNEISESRSQRGNSSKKNVKLQELEKATTEKTTRLKEQGDNQLHLTPKRARCSLKLVYSHENDEVNLL
ncbi:uncharacterized protein LOC116290059 [Actinia tenebrosa]|uniref:Uncharacterized protein LOC116290059 n=1 Tax=Actinia tenebrosa TaxID=6105 RepID=A0A6P8HBB1_ACTTE|nr:uncharacterized protein LOC116290059 [Actinia tenebrosa]